MSDTLTDEQVERLRQLVEDRSSKICGQKFNPKPYMTRWCQLPKGHEGNHG